jgi:amino acid adenylation domain-containing protein
MHVYRTAASPSNAAAAPAAPTARVGTGRTSICPTTAGQREIWLAASLHRDTAPDFNDGLAIELHGPLQIDALHAALDDLLERHEALRATLDDDGQQVRIAATASIAWDEQDWRGQGSARRELLLEQARQQALTKPFEPGRLPLRAELLRLDEHCAVLLLIAHAAICDRWSLGLLGRELPALYARRLGLPVELPPVDSFLDFAAGEAAQQNSPPRRAAEAYWKLQYRQPPTGLALPTDRPRPPQRRLESESVDHEIGGPAMDALRRLAERFEVASSTVLLALQAAWLQRLGGSTDLVIAVPLAGQQRCARMLLVGQCSRLLPLRLQIDPRGGFDHLLTQVDQRLSDAHAHAELGLSELLGLISLPRDPARPPLAAVSFEHGLAPAAGAALFPQLVAQYQWLPRAYQPFELSLDATEHDHCVELRCHYPRALYERLTVRHWLHAYERLLLAVDAAPQAALGSHGLVADETLAELRALQPPAQPIGEPWIHRRLLRSAQRQPQRTALQAIDARYDYQALMRRTAQLAHLLRRKGARPGARVGLLLERCADSVIAIIAVLRTGATWVPLDPGYPPERLAFMVSDADLSVLVSHSGLLAGHAFAVDTLLLDRDAAAIAAAPTAFDGEFESTADPSQTPAYLIYTSGSTGRPKGVEVPHSAVSSLLHALPGPLGLTAADRQLAVVTLSFDVSVQDVLLPLSIGAELVLASSEQARDPQLLAALIRSADITVMEATPTTWRMLLDVGFVAPRGFRALAAGEPLPMDVAERLIGHGAEFWNLYGPTETTIHATYWRVEPRAAGMSIGRPIRNWRIWVLDGYGNSCPLGVPGEICIAGDGVALGYHGRPELTAERFVPEPDALSDRQPAPRMYRSGDIGRWCADGLLECLGREDGQIKLRGYRIEIGEIESRLRALPELADAAVVLRADRNGEPRLLAYVVPHRVGSFDARRARAELAAFLPDYMLPQRFVVLPELPRSPSGKTDRAELPERPADTIVDAAQQAPTTPLEHCLHAIWTDLLPGRRFGVADDFFQLGGHSLLAVRVFHAAAERTGVNLPLATLYRAPTIEALAEAFAAAGSRIPHRQTAASQPSADPWHPLVPIRPMPGDRPSQPPLFLIHAVGGNVMNYRRLAERLPADLPIYGLQAVGLDGVTAPLTRVEAMAERYLAEVMAVQPRGPYRLGGGSMGGVIAFEVARRLRLRGCQIEHLLLFDADIRHGVGRPFRKRGVQAEGALSQRLRRGLRRGQTFVDRLHAAACRLLRRPLPHAARYRLLQAINQAAYVAYRPEPYDGPITLFIARDEHAGAGASAAQPMPDLGWSAVAQQPLRIEALPGTHDSLIEQPELPHAIVRALSSC